MYEIVEVFTHASKHHPYECVWMNELTKPKPERLSNKIHIYIVIIAVMMMINFIWQEAPLVGYTFNQYKSRKTKASFIEISTESKNGNQERRIYSITNKLEAVALCNP